MLDDGGNTADTMKEQTIYSNMFGYSSLPQPFIIDT